MNFILIGVLFLKQSLVTIKYTGVGLNICCQNRLDSWYKFDDVLQENF